MEFQEQVKTAYAALLFTFVDLAVLELAQQLFGLLKGK
jgi:hypothetical protein